eukprot:TRINITY_DN23039_c0_g1_i1.p1 TRINITY_DN23039_c0_g1~~TRINITY_DN23039_c0_g1_i1.p1  ORF type:complete len:382 (+),score=61.96 TRINITY_DN23039_c0_g1_i1:72-1217(+)
MLLLLASFVLTLRCAAHRQEHSDVIDASHNATGAKVKICVAGAHTYLNLGDGGCFQHLDDRGNFLEGDSDRLYASKFCPFSELKHRPARALLYHWYVKATNDNIPFAVNDLAMSCLLGEVQDLSKAFHKFPGFVSNEHFCETMLSLPLMFESIGFDGPGLLMEDERTTLTFSFKGNAKRGEYFRVGPNQGCDAWNSKHLGEPKLARLALRAVLPTYFLHRYAQSGTGMVVRGSRAWLSPFVQFKESYWQAPVNAVCAAAKSPADLDGLFSLTNLRARSLVSSKAMERDEGNCQDVTPCNYDSDESKHLGACDVCKNKDYPWFNEASGNCWNGKSDGFSRCLADASAKQEKKSCACHKAICWYFTKDFDAAFAAAVKACNIA